MNVKIVNHEVIEQVANLLETTPQSILNKSPAIGMEPPQCSKCANELNFYDFVKTALDQNIHGKEYMVDFFSSDKGMEKNMSNEVTCSACGFVNPVIVHYRYNGPHKCS